MSESDDRREIEDLLAMAAHASDRRDFDLIRSLYAEGAYENHGEYQGDVNGYIEFAKKTVEGMAAASHLFLRSLIAISGDDAESESVLQIFYQLKGSPPTNVICMCRQFDRYVRTPRGWRFIYRGLCYDWMQSFAADEVHLPLGTLKGTTDHNDPFYSEMPLLAAKLRKFASSLPVELA